MAKISDARIYEIMREYHAGEISKEQAAQELRLSVDDFIEVYNDKFKSGKEDYDANIQKLVSYKGTIREIVLQAKGKHGGTYPLRVVNVYVKPGNERFYEEKSYGVSKENIMKGTSSQHYYPEKAKWSKPLSRRRKPIPGTESEISEPPVDIILRRRKKAKLSIKRKRKCICKNRK